MGVAETIMVLARLRPTVTNVWNENLTSKLLSFTGRLSGHWSLKSLVTQDVFYRFSAVGYSDTSAKKQ